MKSSDEIVHRIFENNRPLRYVPSVHAMDAFSHFLFRLGRRFDRRKVNLSKLVPEAKEFQDRKAAEIVIPIFGESGLLEQCLDSIENSVGIDAKVTVVDNGVPTHIKKMVKKYSFVENYIENEDNKGFGGACNQGMERLSSNFAILLNSDIVLRPDSIRLLIDQMENHSKLGCCASVLVNEYGRYEEIGRVLTKEGNSIAIEGTKRFNSENHKGIKIVPYASFACVAIRRELFEKTGGFDPEFWPAYSEDLDLAIQFHEMGYVCAVSLESIVLHVQGSSTKELPGLAEIKERNRIALLYKHHQFFDSLPLVNHDERQAFRLNRAIASKRESILIITLDKELDTERIAKLLECERDSLILKFVSVLCLNEKFDAIEFTPQSQLDFQNHGVDFFSCSRDSIQTWFVGRIGIYDTVISVGLSSKFESTYVFDLLKSSQPEAIIERK